MIANVIPTAILPVKLAPPGRNGTNPIKLFIQIKKKTVSKNGRYFLYFFSPMADFAMSSLTKIINGSNKDCIPFGAFPGLFLYAFAVEVNIQSISKMLTNIDATFLVIDISQSFAVAASSVVPSAFTATIWFLINLKPLYASPSSK